MKKYKVLMLLSTYGVASGVNTFAMNYLRGFNHENVEVDFAVYFERESPYIAEIKSYGGKTYVLPPVKSILFHSGECRRILRDGKYDIIHDNSLVLTIPIMIAAKLERIPVRILHSHATELGETWQKKIRNKLLLPLLKLSATDYLACSNAAGKAMFGTMPFTIVPNVVQANSLVFDQAKRNEKRNKMGVSCKRVIATVGRAAMQKNPFFALDVIKILSKTEDDIVFWWIGNGSLEKEMKEYANQIGVGEYFVFLGKRSDVVELYQAMDVFFLPSLFEGLPLTGVEAQAMGLPMVVSDTVTDEMVFTDLVDYVSLNESAEVWAKHLKRLLARKVDRESYSDKLNQSVFSDIGCGERLTNLYTEMLHKRGGM